MKELVATADDDQCSIRTRGWSVKEHIGHLNDLEELWWKRLLDFRSKKSVLTAADMTNTKTKEANHNAATIQNILEQFKAERYKILNAVYGFNNDDLSITSLHPGLNKPMRLIDSLYFVAEHDDHHIAIISSILRR